MTRNRLDTPDSLRWWFAACWAGAIAWMLWNRWGAIHWFVLPDTDDNMRFAQVRAWLAGQGWYDLRQHRMDPPAGVSIHWSRIVDLPIAGLFLLLKPFLGYAQAARWACALEPPLAFGVAFFLTERAPPWLRRPVGTAIELLAALLSWFILPAVSNMNSS